MEKVRLELTPLGLETQCADRYTTPPFLLLSTGVEPVSPCSALSYESRSPADGAGNPFMKLLTSGQRRAPRGLETLVGSSSNLNYFVLRGGRGHPSEV